MKTNKINFIKMKNNILVVFAALLALSCSKDDQVSVDSHLKGKLKSVESTDTYTDENGNEVSFITKGIFEYGSNGYANKLYRVEVDGTQFANYYYYSDTKLVSESHTRDGEEVYNVKYEYTGDLITKSTVTTASGDSDSTYKYSYNSEKEVIKKERFMNNNLTTVEVYENLNGNVVKKTVNGTTYTYTYDNKHHLRSNIHTPAKLKIDLDGPNNMIMRNGSVLTYEYNNADFPTKVTENGYETRFYYY